MYNVKNENSLIVTDIVDSMVDYCSIQPDIDESKCKAAALVAQKIDLTKVISKENVERCISPESESDEQLRELVIPALCYYTFARLLTMFPGTFTDGGYHIDSEASDKNVTRTTANEYKSIADSFILEVVAFLETETPSTDKVYPDKVATRIRTFGGKESRETSSYQSTGFRNNQ